MDDDGAAPRRAVVGYAIGSVGTGGFGTLPGLVLGYYLTDSLGVAAAVAALAVTLPKVWDVLVDPLIGRASDAGRRRHGSRRRWLLGGAVTLPLCFVLLFAVPEALRGPAAAAWVVGAFLLATTAFSAFQVPYIALPAELAGTPRARTRLVAPRVAVLAVAILAFGAGGPLVRDLAGGGRPGYVTMAVAAGLVIGVALTVSALLTTSESRPTASIASDVHDDGAGGFAAGLAALGESARFRTLLLAFVLQALATGAMLAAAQYVATYTLRDEGAVTVLFVALVAPALLVMPLARRLADRLGKDRALLLATAGFVVATASLVLARPFPGVWVYAAVALAGVAYAGMQLYPLALLPDVVHLDAARAGRDRAGVLAGLWTAGETAGLAAGPAIVLGLLAATGFVSRAGGEVLTQPASAQWGIVLAFSLLPALLAAASVLALLRFARVHDVGPGPGVGAQA